MDKNCAKHPDRSAVAFCVNCGNAVCKDCFQKYTGRNFCKSCVVEMQKKNEDEKRDAAIPRRAGLPTVRQWTAPDARKGFHPQDVIFGKETRRIAALALDITVVMAAAAPLGFIFKLASAAYFKDVSGFGARLSFYVALLVVSSLYYVIAHWRYGRTPGKKLLGLVVLTYSDGGRVTFFQSVWRWIGFLTAAIWAYTGYLIASRTVGFTQLAKGKAPESFFYLTGAGAVIIATIFSLGLLISLVGKYKRGFHDILGNTIVRMEPKSERRTESAGETGQVPGDGGQEG